MSRVDELIQQLCPGGVVHKELSAVAQTVSGLSGKTKADFSGGTSRYVSYKNAYANPAVDQAASDFVAIAPGERQNRLHKGDVVITGSSENEEDVGMASVVLTEPVEPLYLNSFCFALRFTSADLLLPEFSMYLFRSEPVRTQIRRAASGVTRINISKARFMTVRIPIPPLAVQREIAAVLGTLGPLQSELRTRLSAEMKGRAVQHAHYRNSLLTFSDDVPRVPLRDLASIGTGSRNTNEAIPGGEYPFFVRSQEPLQIDEYEFDETAIITAGDGVGVGKVFHFVDGKYALHQRAYRLHVTSDDLLPKFLFHFIRNDFFRYLVTTSVHASVTSLRRPMFERYPVPVPALSEQQRVIEVLDLFERLGSEIHAALSAEQSARQKQHSYYRNKLLLFDEAPA